MKRLGDSGFENMVSIESLIIADSMVRSRTSCSSRSWDKDWYANISRLHDELMGGFYIHGPYREKDIQSCSKTRHIRVCGIRDRIVQTAFVMSNQQFLINKMRPSSYASIPGRGAHSAIRKISRIMKETPGDLYAPVVDHVKFYDSIDHEALYRELSTYVKGKRMLALLYQIVISCPGVSIGSLMSPWFGNLLLSRLDRAMDAYTYFRYNDNIVVLASSREALLRAKDIIESNAAQCSLQLHPFSIFKIAERQGVGRGLSFVGYVFFRRHTRISKSTKDRIRRRISRVNTTGRGRFRDLEVLGSTKSALMYCDHKNLLNKLIDENKEYFTRVAGQMPRAGSGVLDFRTKKRNKTSTKTNYVCLTFSR